MNYIREESVFRPNDYLQSCLLQKESIPASHSLPSKCILGFFPQAYSILKQKYDAQIIKTFHTTHPLATFDYETERFIYVYPGLGAPMAAMILDELISLGVEIFLFVGPAGILSHSIKKNHVILIESALIDEGTSQHYVNVNEFAYSSQKLTQKLATFFDVNKIGKHTAATWTTDAPYRETPGKIENALSRGCLTVDMEASALMSVASRYQKQITGFFVPQDKVTLNGWSRSLPHSHAFNIKEILDLALQFLLSLP